MDQKQTSQPIALTVAEAAVLLSVSEETIRRMIQSGQIPHVRISNSVRLRRVDLESYLEANVTRDWQPMPGRGRRRAGA